LSAGAISADWSTKLISLLSRSTMGCGVPAGAKMPIQTSGWKPTCGRPLSIMVGTSGRSGVRFAPV
jgi:hypothetical protein